MGESSTSHKKMMNTLGLTGPLNFYNENEDSLIMNNNS
jgi:hypothetical protein